MLDYSLLFPSADYTPQRSKRALFAGCGLIVYGLVLLLRSVALDEHTHVQRLQILEEQMLVDLFGVGTGSHGKTVEVTSKTETFTMSVAHRESWSGVHIESEVPFRSHYLRATNIEKRDDHDQKPQLLLMHGYGTSSALCWRNVMEGLSHKFDIVALDTPGFGRSDTAEFLPSMSSEEVVTMYCDYFDTFQDRVGLISPYVVAHSFGGFLFTHCASKYPHLASNVMLVDVPGFFPSNGGLDYSFAFWFSMGLPQTFLRAVLWGEHGEMALRNLASYVNLNWSPRMVSYWHELHMGAGLVSGPVVATFVKFNVLYAIGENVALVPLMNLTMPVQLLYGENDPIAPMHQGHFLSQLAEGVHVSNLFVVPGTGHVPFFANTKDIFIEMVVDAYDATERGEKSKLAVEIQPGEELEVSKEGGGGVGSSGADMAWCLTEKSLDWALHKCLPISFLSERNQKSMYQSIMRIREQCQGLVRGVDLVE